MSGLVYSFLDFTSNLSCVPVCSILISSANDAAQNEDVARYQRVDIPRELSKRIHGARSSAWNKKFEHFSGSGRSLSVQKDVHFGVLVGSRTFDVVLVVEYTCQAM